MNGYFDPLARKLGVVTLFISCIVMAGWVRSLFVQDTFSIPSWTTSSHIKFVSVSQRLILVRTSVQTERPAPFVFWKSSNRLNDRWSLNYAGMAVIFAVHQNGFASDGGSLSAGNTQLTIKAYQFPHWSVVMPLLLISVVLLFGPWKRTKGSMTKSPCSENRDDGEQADAVSSESPYVVA